MATRRAVLNTPSIESSPNGLFFVTLIDSTPRLSRVYGLSQLPSGAVSTEMIGRLIQAFANPYLWGHDRPQGPWFGLDRTGAIGEIALSSSACARSVPWTLFRCFIPPSRTGFAPALRRRLARRRRHGRPSRAAAMC